MKKLLYILLLPFFVLITSPVTFTWDVPITGTSDLSGYRLYVSTNKGGPYTKYFSTSNTNIVIANTNFISLKTNYIMVVAVSTNGIESDPSNEISFVVTNKPTVVQNFKLLLYNP
jgi:hypothetical protein